MLVQIYVSPVKKSNILELSIFLLMPFPTYSSSSQSIHSPDPFQSLPHTLPIEFRHPRRELTTAHSRLATVRSRRRVVVHPRRQISNAHSRLVGRRHFVDARPRRHVVCPESPCFWRFLPRNPVAIPSRHPKESTDPAR